MRHLWCALASGLLLIGCGSPTGIAPGGIVFDPPPRYATLWADLEKCSGFSGDYNRVTFVRYDTASIPGTAGWIGRANKALYRVEFAAPALAFDGVVAHELLHLLIPESGHPPKYATMCPQVAGWP